MVAKERIIERGQKTLEVVIHQAKTDLLPAVETSVNEVSFLIQVTRMAVDALQTTSADKKLQEARVRGLLRVADLRRAAEPTLETAQVCDLLGVSRETVRKRVDRGQLLALPKLSDRVFPSFQFADGDIVPGFSEVLQSLDTESPFVALSFFLSESPDFGEVTAIEALRGGRPEQVICAARGFLNHGG